MRTKVENIEQKRINKLFKDSFKKKVVQQIDEKVLTLKQARLKCGVSNSILSDWRTKFGKEVLKQQDEKRARTLRSIDDSNQQIFFLKQLKHAKMEAHLYKEIVRLAKSRYGIDLKKNFGL